MFTHLHTHSTYSDGLADPFQLAEHAASLGFTSLALTDHNTLDGHAAFLAAAYRYNLTPILGVELRVTTSMGAGHMVVLPRSHAEYDSLSRLLHRRRTIRLGVLKDCGVVTSGCLGGVIAQHLLRNDYYSALDAVQECRSELGDAFVIEVQPTFGTILAWLLSIARSHGIRCVATNDVHYLHEEDALRHLNAGLYLASDRQMRASSPLYGFDQALEHTQIIASLCAWKS